MGAFSTARVTEVRHWNDRLFSFKTEREPGFRFEHGQFTMVVQKAAYPCVSMLRAGGMPARKLPMFPPR